MDAPTQQTHGDAVKHRCVSSPEGPMEFSYYSLTRWHCQEPTATPATVQVQVLVTEAGAVQGPVTH